MKKLDRDDYVRGVLAGDRAVLARAITLVESEHPKHEALAQDVIAGVLPHTGNARRIGVSGVPGVGKSTFIDAFGMYLRSLDKKIAVLAIDPSSSVTGGSILGDKTRMARLSREVEAFIRPSPSSGTLGGVARKTRETMLLCEAAGFDVVIVETVGVGQSEIVVAEMVDVYLVLMLAGAGDELQGIKRGILEVADVLAINKADGENVLRADRARSELNVALHLLRGGAAWEPPVLTCSAVEGRGLDKIWESLEAHRALAQSSGSLEARRKKQAVEWMWAMIEDGLRASLRDHADVATMIDALEAQVRDGGVPATSAARRVLDAFLRAR